MLNRALKLIRAYHNLTQSEASRRTGLSKSYVSALEAGNKKVTLEVLEKYASAFNIPLSSLMLFAEHSRDRSLAEDARVYVAGKAIKMLDWLYTISGDEDGQSQGDVDGG